MICHDFAGIFFEKGRLFYSPLMSISFYSKNTSYFSVIDTLSMVVWE